MKRIVQGFALFALLISNYAYATTYAFTGENFTTVFGVYTTDMRVTGTITTSSPIPPNSVNLDISPILTSWSFSDGVVTIGSSNGEFLRGTGPRFSTDAGGNITEFSMNVMNSPVANSVGGLNDLIQVHTIHTKGHKDLECILVPVDVCDSWAVGESRAQETSGAGQWRSVSTTSPIPTLSQWSLMLLALLLGMVAIVRIRRQV